MTGIWAGAASGFLLWLASPAVGAGPLAWVALVPAAAAALRGSRVAAPVAYGVYLELLLVPALPFGLADGQWNHSPLPVLVGGTPVLLVALVLVPSLAALLYALRFGRPWGPGLVAVPVLAWVALDLARLKLDPGGLFGSLGASQQDLPTAALAGLGGPSLLALAIAAGGYGIAWSLVRRRAAPALAVAACIALALGAAALIRPEERGRLTVAAVQPGYDTAEEGRPELRRFEPGGYGLAALDTIRDLRGLTREAAARGARLVAWPEAALWVDLPFAPAALGAMRELARETRAAIVVPYFVQPRRHGAAVVVEPSGRVSAPQPKQRPMWFLGERGGNRHSPRPVPAAGTTVGTLLGVDGQDAAIGARLADEGARVLVAATHDWEQLTPYHRALGSLQAAGTGLPLVRADWRYGSAVFDGDGKRVAGAGDALRRTVVVADVSLPRGTTPFARAGDLVGLLALLALAGFGALRLAAARRDARRAAPVPA